MADKKFFTVVVSLPMAPLSFESELDEVTRWANSVEKAAKAEKKGELWDRVIVFQDVDGPKFAFLLMHVVAVVEGAPKNEEKK